MTDAINETQAVLDQYTVQKGLDPERIYGIYSSDLDKLVYLRVDYLQELIDLARGRVSS